MVAMRELLRDLYSDTPPHADLRAAEAARAYSVPRTTCQSDYLFYLEEDVTLAVANAARLGVSLGAVCAGIVESLSDILNRAYNDHTARGEVGGEAGGYDIGLGGGGGLASLGASMCGPSEKFLVLWHAAACCGTLPHVVACFYLRM